MTLRVLVITPWFPNEPADQAGNFVLHSVEALRDAGVALSVIVARPWTPRSFGWLHPDWVRPPLRTEMFDPALNLRVVHFPSFPRSYWSELSGPLFRIGTRASIIQVARQMAPHVIHAHTEAVGHGVLPIARELRTPLAITLHGINTLHRLLDTEWKRQRMGNALRGAGRVVLVGEPLRSYFGGLAGGEDNFRVVPNGFAVSVHSAQPRAEAWGNNIRWISVSNLHEGKGIDLTLQALAKLRQAGLANWSYDIVGGGAERKRLEVMAEALGLQDNVRFHGTLPHDQAMRLLGQADVFVLPSYREAFGIAYLESMALGLLAIGVIGQGPASFISHGRTGLLVRPNDSQALFVAMKSVLENGLEMQQIAAAGQRHVRSEFTWAKHAEKLLAVYREARGGN
jgi:glycosyltransferase involved in cell wall biosynthesis